MRCSSTLGTGLSIEPVSRGRRRKESSGAGRDGPGAQQRKLRAGEGGDHLGADRIVGVEEELDGAPEVGGEGLALRLAAGDGEETGGIRRRAEPGRER